MRYYEALGLEPKLNLDLEDLKQRFYQRSRQWHPDRFSRAGESERQQALDVTALLNDAFRALRDPIARAEYFLHEKGMELSKDVPPELLEEVFELNMALEEIRSGDESARDGLELARQRFTEMQSKIDIELAELAKCYDASPDPAALDDIRGVLNRRRYISNLLRDVNKEFNVNLPN